MSVLDYHCIGLFRAEEFEFHWWDHAFNKAAKNITVGENSEGDILVDMKLDKTDLSTKKIRKKMMKQVRKQLYSNFVKSGTLTGGKMEDENREDQFEEISKDLSKIKELSDDQLVAACGGLTAHKGGRHGLNMKAKLDRVAEAEREFMEKYGGGITSSNDAVETEKVKKEKKTTHKEISMDGNCSRVKKRKKDTHIELDEEVIITPKKKKKKDKDIELLEEVINMNLHKKKKKKDKDVEALEEVINMNLHKKKKKKKSKSEK